MKRLSIAESLREGIAEEMDRAEEALVGSGEAAQKAPAPGGYQ